MSQLILKRLPNLLLFSIFIVGTTSKPTSYPNKNVEQALEARASLTIVKTTFTDTQTIDWIQIDSQGNIAEVPPPRTPRNTSRPIAELEQPGAELGPPGTVPISRTNTDYLSRAYSKKLPGNQSVKRQTSDAGVHWYVSSNQTVDNIGGSGIFSLFAPYTESSADSSLLQTAVIKQNVQLEMGNDQGGWNTDYTGWVQVDSKIHPGSVFTPLSVDGGVQHDLKLEYNLFKGNWWLAVEDRWIGYYPASLFSNASTGDASSTLAGGSDTILFYGEIYNSEENLTTTDMGSGEFASKGYGRAGYIFDITYTNTKNVSKPYNGVFSDSDDTRYSHEAHFLSGTSRGSYAFIGGPGAGGVVGG